MFLEVKFEEINHQMQNAVNVIEDSSHTLIC